MTVASIVAETGCSAGAVAKSPAWRAFQDKREGQKGPSKPRTIELSTKMLAVIPDEKADYPAGGVLEKLIQDQERELEDEER